MKLQLITCHGSGNDFILLDAQSEHNPPLSEAVRAQLSRTLCDRAQGIGADGILYYQSSTVADCAMRMYNPDGSEAEMCGNGLRCVGRYAAEAYQRSQVSVETPKTILQVKQTTALQPGVPTYSAEIGPVSLQTVTLPMLAEQDQWQNQPIPELMGDLAYTALSIPNPHIVALVDQIDEHLVQQLGQQVNQLPRFPNGVNLSVARYLEPQTLFVMTYERGVGITNACGTAMSAASYVSVLHGKTSADRPITIYNKGGMVLCTVNLKQHQVLLQGNATFIADHVVELNEAGTVITNRHTQQTYAQEQQAYAALQTYAQQYLNARIDT